MIVQKFGGTSVADGDRMLAAARIVAAELDARPIVVVSALGGVTDLLVRAVELAAQDDREALEPVLAELERRHRWVLPQLAADGRARHDLDVWLDGSLDELRQYLRSVRFLGEVTGRARDTLLSFGERWSSRLLTAALRREGVDAVWVDPASVVGTDATHGEAIVDPDRTRTMCRAVLSEPLARGCVPVIGGFTGSSPSGRTTTLGRGGGDTSAAAVGSAMEADEIQIWTDVDGLLTADPRVVPSARTLERATFAEAAELAFYGARVLHPASIEPAVRRNIPVRVRNAARPDGAGTTIVAEDPATPGIASIASRRGIQVHRLVSTRMCADPDFLAAVARALRRGGVTPDVLVASEIGVAVAVRREEAGAGAAAELFGSLATVRSFEDRAVVCVVGSGLAVRADLRARALEALGAVGAEIVAAGGSGSAVAAVLPEAGLDDAVRRLHARFFDEETDG